MPFVQVLASVVPLAILGALSPFNISLVILMLMSEEVPLARARAFASGFVTSLVVIGTIAFGILSDIRTPPLRPGTYLIIATLGVVMAILGVREFVTSVDPDEPPKEWMEHLTEFRPFVAFWIGFAVSAMGLKTLGIYATALGVILTAGLGFIPAILSIVIVILLMCSTLWIPIVVYATQQDRGAELMERTQSWMQRQQARIGGSVLVLIGAFMLWIGLQGAL
jgi:threonine/homoserine/homoserine lactone efflux protein